METSSSIRDHRLWCAASKRAASNAAFALVFCAGVLLAGSAQGQAREDGAPAEAMGVGDHMRASAWGPAALYYNPAGMSLVRTYVMQVGYSYLDGKDGHGFSAAAVDSRLNEWVALGAAYTFITSTPEGIDRDGHQFRGGLSTGYRSGDVGVYAGVGVRYLGLTLGDNDDESTETDDVDAWTVDAGLIVDLGGRIRFGVTGQNLIDSDSPEVKRTVGLGAAFTFASLEVMGDLDIAAYDGADQTVLRWGFGAQYFVQQMVYVRAGITIDEALDETRISGGVGFSTQSFAIDAGYSSDVDDDADPVFSLSLRYVPKL